MHRPAPEFCKMEKIRWAGGWAWASQESLLPFVLSFVSYDLIFSLLRKLSLCIDVLKQDTSTLPLLVRQAFKQARKQGNKEASKQASKEARKQGSKEARKQGSTEARKQGRQEARTDGREEGRKQGKEATKAGNKEGRK